MNSYIITDIIRISAKFMDWAGEPFNPDLIVIRVYNSNKELILEENVSLNQLSIGEYFYDFVPPDIGDFVYEFSGVLLGYTYLRRAQLRIILAEPYTREWWLS